MTPTLASSMVVQHVPMGSSIRAARARRQLRVLIVCFFLEPWLSFVAHSYEPSFKEEQNKR
jgi:hypothetical protein